MQSFFKIFFLFFLLSNCKLLFSQSKELREEYRQTNKYFKEQNFSKALESNNRALELSIKEFSKLNLTTATLHENKAILLIELQDYRKAEVIFREVVETRTKLIENYTPELAETLDYLVLSLRKQNKLETSNN